MAEIWKPHPPKVYRDWTDKIMREFDKLNGWEQNFIWAINYQLNKKQSLSQAQAEKLENIYVERTP